MNHHITHLGIFHTLVSVVPIIAGIYSFHRYKIIDTTRRSGKVYILGLVLSVITSLMVSSTGGLNAGHAFGIFILIMAFGSLYIRQISFLGKLRPYLTTFGLSFSFLLSLIPGTNETLTRLPPSQPLAEGPSSPIVLITLLIWLSLFIIGYILQCSFIYKKQRID